MSFSGEKHSRNVRLRGSMLGRRTNLLSGPGPRSSRRRAALAGAQSAGVELVTPVESVEPTPSAEPERDVVAGFTLADLTQAVMDLQLQRIPMDTPLAAEVVYEAGEPNEPAVARLAQIVALMPQGSNLPGGVIQ